jgi:hypothetical protein
VDIGRGHKQERIEVLQALGNAKQSIGTLRMRYRIESGVKKRTNMNMKVRRKKDDDDEIRYKRLFTKGHTVTLVCTASSSGILNPVNAPQCIITSTGWIANTLSYVWEQEEKKKKHVFLLLFFSWNTSTSNRDWNNCTYLTQSQVRLSQIAFDDDNLGQGPFCEIHTRLFQHCEHWWP